MIEFAGKRVGDEQPCFIIAEAGVNHNGDLAAAFKLVDAAVAAHADAVKFQTFNPDKLVSASAPKADYQKLTTDAAESQYHMLRQLMLSSEDHRQLKTYCAERGILFMSTPFDADSADLLDELGVPVFKIGSGELTNLPLLAHIARKGKPLILSTGMSYLSEVETALRAVYTAGNQQVVVLHCVSNYPTTPGDANLRAMHTLKTAFQIPVGYSDHTPGIEVSLAAVALGAVVIEKHFTLSRALPGPDQASSLEPDELAELVQGIRNVEAALGHGRKEPAPSEASVAAAARRSLIAARDLPAGTVIDESAVAIKRPGTGLPPSMLPYVIGRTVRAPIAADSLISLEMLS